jgi:hypothetical protein
LLEVVAHSWEEGASSKEVAHSWRVLTSREEAHFMSS